MNEEILSINIKIKKKECYSEIFDIKTLKNLIKKENNEIELFTCFNYFKQKGFICKWCKNNCFKNFILFNKKIKLIKMNKSQIKKLKNFNCICKQNNHSINDTYFSNKFLFNILNVQNLNDLNSIINFKDKIEEMINNKNYEEIIDVFLIIKESKIEIKGILKFDDKIWKDLIIINNDNFKINIIRIYFEFYIYDYFITSYNYYKNKRNFLFWFDSLRNKNIVYKNYLLNIIIDKIKNMYTINLIQPILFLKNNNISIENLIYYLLNSDFILENENFDYLMLNFLIKYSSLKMIESNDDNLTILNINNKELYFILIKIAYDLEILEEFLLLGKTQKTQFINQNNIILKGLILNLFNNKEHLFYFIKMLFLNNKIITYNESIFNKKEILFVLSYIYNNNKYSNFSQLNLKEFNLNNIYDKLEYYILILNKSDNNKNYLLFQEVEMLIIEIFNLQEDNDIEINLIDNSLKLIKLMVKNNMQYFLINSYILTVLFKFIINNLNLNNKIHLDFFFQFYDIFILFPKTEIELILIPLLENEISKENHKNKNISFLYYLFINPELEEFSFLKTDKYFNLLDELSKYFIKIFEIKRINSLITYFNNFDINLSINELLIFILKNKIEENDKFIEFSINKLIKKENKILENELIEMNKNSNISNIYILYFIKTILFLKNKHLFLKQELFLKFYDFLNNENENENRLNNYNNIKIFENENIPICIKSLLFELILKISLTLKIDNYYNIYRHLSNKQEMIRKKILNIDDFSLQEKIDCFYKNKDKKDLIIYYIEEKLFKQNYLIIKNIFEIISKIFLKLNNFNNSETLKEYFQVILKGLNYCFNMLINSYDIFDQYFKNFRETLSAFTKIDKNFFKIIGKDYLNNLNINFDENDDKIEILKKYKLIYNNFRDIIDKKNNENIYDIFFHYNNESLFPKIEDYYLCFFENNKFNKITLEDLNSFEFCKEENSNIYSNFLKWIEFNNKIKYNDIIKILISINVEEKDMDLNMLDIFIKQFFIVIMNSNSHYILEYDEIYILIKIFKLNKNYIDYLYNSGISITIENKIEYFSKNIIPIVFIGKLIKSINFYCNYEISISNSFSNTKHENILSKYLNALIILITTVSNNFEVYIFEYYYDFSNNEYSQSFIDNDLNFQNKEEDNIFFDNHHICSPYECMILLYQKIYNSLIVYCFYKENELRPNQYNLLILFDSITNFLISFDILKTEKHKKKLRRILNQFFKIHLKNNIFKFIDNPLFIDKENYDEFQYNPDYLFIKKQLIRLFVFFIELNNEEIFFYSYLSKYKYEINYYLINDLILIINSILNSKNNNEFVILYKKNNINYANNSNSFYKFLISLFQNSLMNEFKDYSSLIFLYYKTLRIFVYKYNFCSCKILFEESNNDKELFELVPNFLKSNLKIINLKGLFKFFNSIFIEIDYRYIQINEKSHFFYENKKYSFFMNPNNYYLSKYFKEIFLDLVNRTSRDNKMAFLNYFIDIAVYDCIYIKNKTQSKKYFLYFIDLNFKIFEIINLVFLIIENFYLLILFYKDIHLSIDEYNTINSKNYNNLGYSYLWVIVIFHSFFLAVVLICWGYFYFYRYYFYCLARFCRENRIINSKLLIENKFNLYHKMYKNNDDYNKIKINNIFPFITNKNLIKIYIKELFFLSHKTWALFTFIFTILYFMFSPFFIIISWIYIGNFFPGLLNVFRSLKNNFYLIFSIYFYTYALVYILSWAVFFFIPKFFTLEVTNKNNEIYNEPEAQCSSSVSCLLYFLNYALYNGGNISSNLVSFKRDVIFYLEKFFIEVIFYQLLNWIFTNIFLALVTRTFENVDKSTKKNEFDKNTKCFICDMNYKKCIQNNINFKDHCKIKHSIWKYLYFIVQILIKNENELNYCEKYILYLLKNNDLNWLPYEGNDDNEKYISPIILNK